MSQKYFYSEICGEADCRLVEEEIRRKGIKAEKARVTVTFIYRMAPDAYALLDTLEVAKPHEYANRIGIRFGPMAGEFLRVCDHATLHAPKVDGSWTPIVLNDVVYTIGKIIYGLNYHVRFLPTCFKRQEAALAHVKGVLVPLAKDAKEREWPAFPKEDFMVFEDESHATEHVVYLSAPFLMKNPDNPRGVVCSWHIKKTEVLG